MTVNIKLSVKKIIVLSIIFLIAVSNIILYTLSTTYFEKLVYENIKKHSVENMLKTIEMIQLKLEYQYQISWGILNDSQLKGLLEKSSNVQTATE